MVVTRSQGRPAAVDEIDQPRRVGEERQLASSPHVISSDRGSGGEGFVPHVAVAPALPLPEIFEAGSGGIIESTSLPLVMSPRLLTPAYVGPVTCDMISLPASSVTSAPVHSKTASKADTIRSRRSSKRSRSSILELAQAKYEAECAAANATAQAAAANATAQAAAANATAQAAAANATAQAAAANATAQAAAANAAAQAAAAAARQSAAKVQLLEAKEEAEAQSDEDYSEEDESVSEHNQRVENWLQKSNEETPKLFSNEADTMVSSVIPAVQHPTRGCNPGAQVHSFMPPSQVEAFTACGKNKPDFVVPRVPTERPDRPSELENQRRILKEYTECHQNEQTTAKVAEDFASIKKDLLEKPNSQPNSDTLGLQQLATAIAQAARMGNPAAPPRYIAELPYFGGEPSEWLSFRAAYMDTERYFSDVENTARLRRALRGTAKEAVNCLFLGNTQPTEVLHRLEARFGRPEALVISEMNKIKELPKLTDSPTDVCVFASKVENIVATVEALGRHHHLYNPEMVREIEGKLTPIIRSRWFDFEINSSESEPGLIKLKRFLVNESEKNARHAVPEVMKPRPGPSENKKNKEKHRTFNGTKISPQQQKENIKVPTECPVCEENHQHVSQCPIFKNCSTSDRWKLAKRHKLCYRCLRPRLHKHKCPYVSCGIENCDRSHHKLLHHKRAPDAQQEDKEPVHAVVASTVTPESSRVYLKVIPVTISGPAGKVDTFALLDDGSTVTLLKNEVAKKIGAQGPQDPFFIEAIAGARVDASESKRVKVQIRGRHQEENINIAARTINNLDISPQTVDRETLTECKHLTDIASELVYGDGIPSVLIGQDNWELLLASEVRQGEKQFPIASLTPLGWVLHGRRANPYHKCSSFFAKKVNFCNPKDNAEDLKIEEMLKEHFDLDSLGITPKRPHNDPEQRALNILSATTKPLENGGYETGLLWRKDDFEMPNNYDTALNRLYGVEKKLGKDPALKEKYKQQMNTLLLSGYAEEAISPPTPGRTWYLPHFPVLNPAKPGKVRIVHDAAAKTRGLCLNDFLLTGPDLLQSLMGVMMRFRQYPIAIVADIKDMFLRIQVKEQDRDALRFLWRESTDSTPKEYRMKSVIFGATSSPATAIYVKDSNAERFKDRFPDAEKSIKHNHYMDDFLQSFQSVDEANRIAKEVNYVHQQAKFELHKWTSNNPAALKGLGVSTSDDIHLGKEEKVLGMIWQPKEDVISFNLNFSKIDAALMEGQKEPTKRELLKTAMSLYDPLGLIAPVTVQAKHILQTTWREKIDWDDKLPKPLISSWSAWLSALKKLSSLQIPRSYPGYANARKLELHTFVDASQSTYATAIYWRVITESGNIEVSLAAAKARVASLKLQSIPRLELQAAILGSRLAQTVLAEHEKPEVQEYFWSDSRTVISWLRAEAKTFKPFVAHRIAEIQEHTNIGDWRWLPTEDNVADDATRDIPPNFDSNHRWFRGPTFLYQEENLWPKEPQIVQEQTGEERVKCHHTALENKIKLSEAIPSPDRFSSWLRLIRTTARILQFIDRLKTKKQNVTAGRIKSKKNDERDPTWQQNVKTKSKNLQKTIRSTSSHNFLFLGASYVNKAEELQLKTMQEFCFKSEIDDINGGRQLARNSRLRQVALWIDPAGILRVKSRIKEAEAIAPYLQAPAIVDGKHRYCRLYIEHIHRQTHHGGVEFVTNEVRQRYWVLQLRPTVRTVVKSCIQCRIRRAVPPTPPTGDLPHGRVAHHRRPFSYTGLDYFGPVSVTVGRSHQKRYVALFTCLTTRAIHLEIAASLSTDSAIMALRRMIARRGCPTEIWSDNGTNFKGADAELQRAALQATQEEASIHAIEWRFIPPSSPFMGGAWERMVRSVKTALSVTLNERHPHEETLATLLAEVEHTVNSRPLTHVSIAPEDDTALTPNHFLLGGPSRVPIPGTFIEKDLVRRENWRTSQRLADVFWNRWVREALPLLQHRREPSGKGEEIKIGDLVLVVDGTLPRNVWPRGIVVNVYPGRDGIVRVADIKTKSGIMRRPSRKLIVLPMSK